jgi:hypothetical protein
VKTLVGLSRFVIVDFSGPSVPQELYATVPHFKIPFAPIFQAGMRTYAMFADIQEYPWVLPPVAFKNEEDLLDRLVREIVEPAEKKVRTRQALLSQTFGG